MKSYLVLLIPFVIAVICNTNAHADYTFDPQIQLSQTTGDILSFSDIKTIGNNVYVMWEDSNTVLFQKSTDGGKTFDPAPTIVSNGLGNADQPRIAASANYVYMVWSDHTSGNNEIFFARSSDSGTSFDIVDKKISMNLTNSGGPMISISGNNVYVTWLESNIVYFTRSTDNGNNFDIPVRLSDLALLATNEQIASSGSSVHIVWKTTVLGNDEIFYEKSSDDGNTFNLGTPSSPGSPINISNNSGGSESPQIAVSDSNVFITWDDFTPGNDDIFFTRSTNGGDSFEPPTNISNDTGGSGFEPPQIVASGNNVYLIWQDDTTGNMEILFARSTDDGNSFNGSIHDLPGPSLNLSNNTGVSVVPEITQTGNNVNVAWKDSTSGKFDIFLRTSSDDGATFGGQNVISDVLDPTSTDSFGQKLAVADSRLDIVWLDDFNDPGNSYDIFFRTGMPTTTSIVFNATQYKIGSTALISVTSTSSNADPTTIETIGPVKINSTSDGAGIEFNFTETGVDSGIFGGTIHFTTGTSSGNNLHVSAGDVITATFAGQPSSTNIFSRVIAFNLDAYLPTSNVVITVTDQNSNIDPTLVETIPVTVNTPLQTRIFNFSETGSNTGIFVIPSGSHIQASIGFNITASYLGATDFALIIPPPGPGGGGGGLIRPGLVLDVASSILGKGGSSYVPPTLTLNTLASAPGALPDYIRQEVLNHDPYKPMSPANTTIDLPFYIDGSGYALAGHTNTIVTRTELTGVPVDIKLNIPASNIQHVALYTNLRGTDREISQSDTYVMYEKDQPLQIFDPYGYIDHVNFDLTKTGYKNIVKFDIIFAKPMEKSDIDFRIWDDRKSTSDTRILDAWQIESQSQTSSAQNAPITNTQSEMSQSKLQDKTPDIIQAVKDWGGYSVHPISDSELLSEIGLKGQHIPSWVMETTKWVVNGNMSADEFLTVIKYMYENEMIK